MILCTHTHGYSLKALVFNILKLIIFLTILSICFILVNNVVKRKEAYQKTADFFEQKEDFNILFFGSSRMHYSVFPMQLWRDYGYVTYNLGNDGERLATTYYNVILACEQNKPDMIVVDNFFCHVNEKVSDTGAETHRMLDGYPISHTKYLAIKDLFGEGDLIKKEFEYLFNFSAYHNRWNEIREGDFIRKDNLEKGATSKTGILKQKQMSEFKSIEAYDKEETINMQYLRKIIEYCKINDIKILMTYMPYCASDNNIAVSKYINKICNEYSVNYINFLEKDIVNYDIDCFDKDGHLNPSGARKVTDYIGKYIRENYDIPDQRENESYSFWNNDYDEYIDFKIENLKKNKTNLNNYLMLLYGEDDISYDIKISSKRQIEDGSVLQQLLKNLNNNYEISDDEFVSNANKTIKITIKDNRNGKVIDTVWF